MIKMKIKNKFNLQENPTSTKLKPILYSSLDKFTEFDKKLKKEIIYGDNNTYLNYRAYDLDDFNAYSKGAVAEVEDIESFSNLLRDIADYLDNTYENIGRITISYRDFND